MGQYDPLNERGEIMMNLHLPYRIIDAHTHMGLEYCLFYEGHDADSLVKYMDEVGVEMIFSAPVEDLMDGGSRRAQIQDAMTRYPDRIRGYYCVNPLLGYTKESIQKAFDDYPGYVGLKFLPDYHRTNLTDEIYRPAFEWANEHHALVLSHTWGVSMMGESCNSSDKVAGILDKYKNIRFIMGHSCQGQVDAAIELAVSYKNAYLDLCDTVRLNGVLEKMVRRAGADKITFGTDAPMQGFCFQLGCVLGARIGEDEKKRILRDNALEIVSYTGRTNGCKEEHANA